MHNIAAISEPLKPCDARLVRSYAVSTPGQQHGER